MPNTILVFYPTMILKFYSLAVTFSFTESLIALIILNLFVLPALLYYLYILMFGRKDVNQGLSPSTQPSHVDQNTQGTATSPGKQKAEQAFSQASSASGDNNFNQAKSNNQPYQRDDVTQRHSFRGAQVNRYGYYSSTMEAEEERRNSRPDASQSAPSPQSSYFSSSSSSSFASASASAPSRSSHYQESSNTNYSANPLNNSRVDKVNSSTEKVASLEDKSTNYLHYQGVQDFREGELSQEQLKSYPFEQQESFKELMIALGVESLEVLNDLMYDIYQTFNSSALTTDAVFRKIDHECQYCFEQELQHFLKHKGFASTREAGHTQQTIFTLKPLLEGKVDKLYRTYYKDPTDKSYLLNSEKEKAPHLEYYCDLYRKELPPAKEKIKDYLLEFYDLALNILLKKNFAIFLENYSENYLACKDSGLALVKTLKFYAGYWELLSSFFDYFPQGAFALAESYNKLNAYLYQDYSGENYSLAESEAKEKLAYLLLNTVPGAEDFEGISCRANKVLREYHPDRASNEEKELFEHYCSVVNKLIVELKKS